MAQFKTSEIVKVCGPKDNAKDQEWFQNHKAHIGKTGKIAEVAKWQNIYYYQLDGIPATYFEESLLTKKDPTTLDIIRKARDNYFNVALNKLNKREIDLEEFRRIDKFCRRRFHLEERPIEFDNHAGQWALKRNMFKCSDCQKWYGNIVRKECTQLKMHCQTCFSKHYTICTCGNKCWVGPKNDPQLVKVYDRTDNLQGIFYLPSHEQILKMKNGKYYIKVKIPKWHSAHRQWDARPMVTKSELYGVELEVWCTDRTDVFDELPFERGFVGETDSSLCDVHGMEIVGPPMSLQSYYGNDSIWHKVIGLVKQNKGKAFDAGRNYGMHVNVNKNQFQNSNHMAHFACFIYDNKHFCEAIAMRTEEDVEKAVQGRKPFTYRRKKETFEEVLYPPDKYQAVLIKDKVIEVRIFRATLLYSGFLKNIELCAAVWEFTKTGYKPLKDFIKFLEENKEKYRNLYKFVWRKKLHQ